METSPSLTPKKAKTVKSAANDCHAISIAVRKSSTVYSCGSRFMLRPRKDVKSSQAVKNSSCDMGFGIVLLEYCVECALQQEQNNRLYNLCDVVNGCQTTVNVYQRRLVIKHYATPYHDAQCRTSLRSVKWVEMRFIDEQYPMPFAGTAGFETILLPTALLKSTGLPEQESFAAVLFAIVFLWFLGSSPKGMRSLKKFNTPETPNIVIRSLGVMARKVIGYTTQTPLVVVVGNLNSRGYISHILRSVALFYL
ncbi:hypothetical protein TNCV_2857661 [Trichonephila clavipes]|nr:hypothetical protein TNCV_2857661 [Trichonephila clavipes]